MKAKMAGGGKAVNRRQGVKRSVGESGKVSQMNMPKRGSSTVYSRPGVTTTTRTKGSGVGKRTVMDVSKRSGTSSMGNTRSTVITGKRPKKGAYTYTSSEKSSFMTPMSKRSKKK